MEDGIQYISGIDNKVLLCVAIGLAVAFLLILAFDSYRRKRARRRMGKHARGSISNPISRWYRRTRHSLRSMKEVYQHQKRTKAIRERSRSRSR
ncbi:MAG: hypothetical protein JWR69_3026 [Pedosphaera sp.]|nr:hypothetical protein [Pedosphaera sp.]